MKRAALLAVVVVALAGCSAKTANQVTTSTVAPTATTATPATTVPATISTTAAPPPTIPTTSTASAPTGGAPITRSPSGNLYKAGELCPQADAGFTIQGNDGPITCEQSNGLRWVAG